MRWTRARMAWRFAWSSVSVMAAASACSAILGIDDIPPAGEFPIDGGGKTCAELQAEVDTFCGMAAASKGVSPSECTIQCGSENGSMADCICGSNDGSGDGSTGPDGVVHTDTGTHDGMMQSDTPPAMDSCSMMNCMDAPMDMIVPTMDSPEETPTGDDASE
jgi:hypothetical protein